MSFELMDASEMRYQEESMDLIFDKATLDGMMCGQNYLIMSGKVINEVFRILKVGGIYVVISYSEDRKYLFERECVNFNI